MKKLTITKETLSVLSQDQAESVNGGLALSGVLACNNSAACTKVCGISQRGNCM